MLLVYGADGCAEQPLYMSCCVLSGGRAHDHSCGRSGGNSGPSIVWWCVVVVWSCGCVSTIVCLSLVALFTASLSLRQVLLLVVRLKDGAADCKDCFDIKPLTEGNEM